MWICSIIKVYLGKNLMFKEEKIVSNNNFNVRNLMVNKEKISEFLDEIQQNQVLKDCKILRVLNSGNYYIYTFETSDEQRKELKKIQDNWI